MMRTAVTARRPSMSLLRLGRSSIVIERVMAPLSVGVPRVLPKPGVPATRRGRDRMRTSRPRPGVRTDPSKICAPRDTGDVLCGALEVVEWILVIVDGHGGGHDSLAVGGDAVETRSWDFGDQPVAAEFDDQP